MKVALLWVGKTRNPHLHSLVQDYSKRLAYFCDLSIREVAAAKAENSARIIALESEGLLKRLTPSDFVVLLDDHGETLTTREFAAFLKKHRDSCPRPLVFLIGGHEGVSRRLRERADRTLSLSSMTLTHEFVRPLLLEQVYRAFSILNGFPYHK
jgi:23S rRNA (pseudouridine1915-N3)-methyltransferase